MTTADVSVVVPTRNRAALLERTLRSILAQQGPSLEVVVVDDGSEDATAAVVAAAGSRARRLRHDRPQGVAASRNHGIAETRGVWVAFCDDDDLWAPDKLRRQLDAAESAGADWVYAGDVNVDDRLCVLSGGHPPDPTAVVALLPRWNPISSGGSNVVVRRAVLDQVGHFDPSLRRTEDWDLWIRLGRRSPPAWVDQPLVAYRFHTGNVTVDPAAMVAEARTLAGRYGIPVDLAAMHRRAAWAALRGGRRLEAARAYGRAVAMGDVRSLARAAVALVHPAVGSERVFSLAGRDDDWIARAERWLAGLRDAAPPEQEGTR